ncbi:MAG TPA: hypothetical protein VK254_01965 [Candidatus Bathyarchaeia archaeon]|nr:hypothetical protein [Candidatus Bathyarchaeia archaeon]
MPISLTGEIGESGLSRTVPVHGAEPKLEQPPSADILEAAPLTGDHCERKPSPTLSRDRDVAGGSLLESLNEVTRKREPG